VLRRRRGAPVALAVSVLGCTAVAAAWATPSAWLEAEPPGLALPTDPLAWLWLTLGALIPAGTTHQSLLFLGVLFCIAVGAAATWFGYQLFRGPGRIVAAITAGPLSTAALLNWLSTIEPSAAFPALPFTLVSLLSVAALIRPLVHLGRVTPVACARALAAASAGAAVSPKAGLPLLAAVGAICIIRGRRLKDLGEKLPSASLSRATMAGNPWTILAVALPIPVVAGVVAWVLHERSEQALAWIPNLHLMAPPMDLLRAHLNPYLIYPAFALVLLLAGPLRWRGGLAVLGLVGAALVVGANGQPLAPAPVLLVSVTVCLSGWVWLAGSMRSKPRWLGFGFACAAAGPVFGLGLGGPWASQSVADARPSQSVAHLVDHALMVPGDVLLLHDDALLSELAARRRDEGQRPDVGLLDARQLQAANLQLMSMAWMGESRRVLSDSFSLGGRWKPQWAIDAGPVFWFGFEESVGQQQEFVLLPVDLPGSSTAQRRRWARMHLERARFRRAIGRDVDAVSALPLPESGSLRTAVRVSRSINLAAEPGSMLGALGDTSDVAPLVPAFAEAGDLLFSAGEHEMGVDLLTQAAAQGHAPAWRALARWQLASGARQSAAEVLDTMADDESLRSELIVVAWWLLERDRPAEALEIRDRLRVVPDDAAAELSLRLGILGAAGAPAEP
jgi:hypothetical protein